MCPSPSSAHLTSGYLPSDRVT